MGNDGGFDADLILHDRNEWGHRDLIWARVIGLGDWGVRVEVYRNANDEFDAEGNELPVVKVAYATRLYPWSSIHHIEVLS